MAGMLPGVECARRRRFHQSRDAATSAAHSWTRRSSFCLYTTINDNYFHTSSIPSLNQQRSILPMASEDEKLGGVAREAKERLDEKLRSKWKSDDTRRRNSKERVMMGSNGELQTEVYGAKKKSSSRVKIFNWAKVLRWKGTDDQDECTICLDRFKSGQSLTHLPCPHLYHPRCLVPWLETNAHCPCCRMEIHVQFSE